jgi:hypothetical protein
VVKMRNAPGRQSGGLLCTPCALRPACAGVEGFSVWVAANVPAAKWLVPKVLIDWLFTFTATLDRAFRRHRGHVPSLCANIWPAAVRLRLDSGVHSDIVRGQHSVRLCTAQSVYLQPCAYNTPFDVVLHETPQASRGNLQGADVASIGSDNCYLHTSCLEYRLLAHTSESG